MLAGDEGEELDERSEIAGDLNIYMPIRGYLEPRPRGTYWAAAGVPILGEGIAVKGPVMEGRMSMHEALVLDRIRAIRSAGWGEMRRWTPKHLAEWTDWGSALHKN